MTVSDSAQAHSSAEVSASMEAHDSIKWSPVAKVEKYDDEMTDWVKNKLGIIVPQAADFEGLDVRPYEVLEVAGNLLTTAGLNRLTALMQAVGGQAATNTSARLGVGDSATAAAVGQTDLQAVAGSTHRWFQVMDATFPTQANGVMTFKSTFATGDGNFVWNEWGVDIGAPTVTSGNTVSALLLNRAVQSLGTKVSGSWVLTATITLS
jgi:hypothetical protein